MLFRTPTLNPVIDALVEKVQGQSPGCIRKSLFNDISIYELKELVEWFCEPVDDENA